MIGPVATFGISLLASRVNPNQSFSVAVVFTSLSIMGLLMEPLGILVSSLPTFIASMACFERIQTFLQESKGHSTATSQEDDRTTGDTSSNDGIELSQLKPQNNSQDIIILERASFAAKPGDAPILQDINIRVLPSTLTMVIGKVGSGKTVLLQGILGELHHTGRIKNSSTGAAYCAQTTWLTNSSIRQNILGQVQAQVDQLWYVTVVRACALDVDFRRLPSGDQALIGSRGLSLSGGQKQRIVSIWFSIYVWQLR